MLDGIESIVVPHLVTPHVPPNALAFTVERGEWIAYVLWSKEACRRLFADKRARTRQERYDLALRLVDEGLLPESSEKPSVRIDGYEAEVMLSVISGFLPHCAEFHSFIYDEERRCDTFMAPTAPEQTSGLAVFRREDKVECAVFRSVEQAMTLLGTHGSLFDPGARDRLVDDLGFGTFPETCEEPMITFTGFAAAFLGAACVAMGAGQSWRLS